MNNAPPRNGEGDQPQWAGRHVPRTWLDSAGHCPPAHGGGGPRVLQAPIKTVKLARRLRREMSPAERFLWWALKERPGDFRFRKQCPQGPFSIDFACLEVRLGIEVDGDAHDSAAAQARDGRRDRYLEGLGFTMLRIPAGEVFRNLEGVVLGIVSECRRLGPLHHAAHGPPPRAGEEPA